MNHPILIAALIEDQRRLCPCGTVASQANGLCRRCQAVVVWHRETKRTRRSGDPDGTYTGTLKTRLLAQVASLLQLIGNGAEN
jgi:hypothetical protein